VLQEEVRRLLGSARRVLFVPHALEDHAGYTAMLRERLAPVPVDGLHEAPDAGAAVRVAEAISVGGGNSFRLVDALHRMGLIEPIRERVRAGVPYMGVSAGSNVACPTLMTTNDMPIVQPPSFDALALVPFQINPHWFPGHPHVEENGQLVPHFGETRDERIAEYHERNDRAVIGLREGAWLRVEGESVTLIGAGARVFRKGHAPVDFVPPADLSGLLLE
jgi:dipeptidase E